MAVCDTLSTVRSAACTNNEVEYFCSLDFWLAKFVSDFLCDITVSLDSESDWAAENIFKNHELISNIYEKSFGKLGGDSSITFSCQYYK